MDLVVGLTSVFNKVLQCYLQLTYLCGLTTDPQEWTMATSIPTSRLLQLLKEIRFYIYRHVFSDRDIEVRCQRSWGANPTSTIAISAAGQLGKENSNCLLSVCKHIYREAIIAYYQRCRVHLHAVHSADVHSILCSMPHLRWHVQEIEMRWGFFAEICEEDDLLSMQSLKSLKRVIVNAVDFGDPLRGPDFETIEEAKAYLGDQGKINSAIAEAKENLGTKSLQLAHIEASRKRHLPNVKIHVRFMLDFDIANKDIGVEEIGDMEVTRHELWWEHDDEFTLRQGLTYNTENRKMAIIRGDLRLCRNKDMSEW